jgi:hypothetical protein
MLDTTLMVSEKFYIYARTQLLHIHKQQKIEADIFLIITFNLNSMTKSLNDASGKSDYPCPISVGLHIIETARGEEIGQILYCIT